MPGRIRTVKPEFFADEDVAALAPTDRLVFLGLLCYADKAGRMEYRPVRLAALVLPYEQKGFEVRLSNLISAGFLIPYENDGRKYLQIRTFATHQRPHHTEPESKLPAPDSDGSTVLQPLQNGYTTDESSHDLGYTTVVKRKGREGNGEGKGERQPRPPVALDGFSDFWPMYPRRVGKGGAEAAWSKLSAADRAAVAAAMPAFKASWASRPPTDLQFCPHPATWLNQRRWEDEPPKVGLFAMVSDEENARRAAAARSMA